MGAHQYSQILIQILKLLHIAEDPIASTHIRRLQHFGSVASTRGGWMGVFPNGGKTGGQCKQF